MTRVNANIKPKELVDRHLSAEFFEIRRVRLFKPDLKINSFRLGKGHVKFFSTYKQTTFERCETISDELIERGLISKESKTKLIILFLNAWQEECYNGLKYKYKPEDNDLCRFRVLESLIKMSKNSNGFKYRGNILTLREAINLLEFETEEYQVRKTKLINMLIL